jgi:RNA polymerase sigma-70 factor, ECF subfamily
MVSGVGPQFQEVLAAASAGDVRAFATLWRATNPVLLRYLRGVAGDLADDVASETWLKVIRALPRFQGDEQGFRGWVVTIARNQLVDERRRASRRPETLTSDVPDVEQASGRDVAQEVVDRLGTEQALRLVATLPPDQAEMLLLRVVVGLDVSHVAQLVGRSPGAVRVAVHRALRRLADVLADEPP